jgi:hypothetical protein
MVRLFDLNQPVILVTPHRKDGQLTTDREGFSLRPFFLCGVRKGSSAMD